jgi:predicted nucleotidyltransferase component of viral defense system
VKSIVPMLADRLQVKDQDLVEQDVRLHLLLGSLTRDPTFGSHLAFKGGTCLIKCYLDYPRFSTDLDFTWVDPPRSGHGRQGTKEIRREIRPTQRQLEKWFAELAPAQGYRTEESEIFHYGRNNRMMTVNLRFPTAHPTEGLVKVQLNFEDPLLFPTVHASARSLLDGALPPEFLLLGGTLATDYATPIPVTAYDPREILVEKCRAILTRTAAKSRDLVDLYLLERDRGLRVEEYATCISEKTRRALQGDTRYRQQAARFDERKALLLEEDVAPILLKPIDPKAFQAHRMRVVSLLGGLLPGILA